MLMLCDSKILVGKLLAIDIFHILTILCPTKLLRSADFAPQIHGAFNLFSLKLWSNADFALQNYRAMQTLACKIIKK